jgi:predicted secreted protein
MSYDNLSSVSQNVLKIYRQLTSEERRSLSFLVGTISNVLAMEIGWTDVGSGGYILVSCAHSNTSFLLIRNTQKQMAQRCPEGHFLFLHVEHLLFNQS